jgi:hypothetical protein
MRSNWKEVWKMGGVSFVIIAVAIGFAIGFNIGISDSMVRIKIQEPEVYENVIQRLESIEEIESFRLERTRVSYLVEWDLAVRLRDDVSFYFRDIEDFSDFNTSIDKIRDYISD